VRQAHRLHTEHGALMPGRRWEGRGAQCAPGTGHPCIVVTRTMARMRSGLVSTLGDRGPHPGSRVLRAMASLCCVANWRCSSGATGRRASWRRNGAFDPTPTFSGWVRNLRPGKGGRRRRDRLPAAGPDRPGGLPRLGVRVDRRAGVRHEANGPRPTPEKDAVWSALNSLATTRRWSSAHDGPSRC